MKLSECWKGRVVGLADRDTANTVFPSSRIYPEAGQIDRLYFDWRTETTQVFVDWGRGFEYQTLHLPQELVPYED